jgi:hypothetical protein
LECVEAFGQFIESDGQGALIVWWPEHGDIRHGIYKNALARDTRFFAVEHPE